MRCSAVSSAYLGVLYIIFRLIIFVFVFNFVCLSQEALDEAGDQKKCGSGEYSELLSNTDFGLVIRGDNLYSYRFLEVLSAGVIPVIFSDWCVVYPFIHSNELTAGIEFD